MKLTQILLKQHAIRWFQRHWHVQGKRKVPQTYDFKVLKRHNIPVQDALEVATLDGPKKERYEIVGVDDLPIPFDENHPLYHEQPLMTFKDSNVLVEGVEQAKVLTKTVEVKEGLPSEIESLIGKKSIPDQHTFVERIILSSLTFDLKQRKLLSRRDPKRPMFKFPPVYGISDRRRNLLLCNRLLQLSENIFGGEVANHRRLLTDAPFCVPFKVDDKNVQFEITSELALTSTSRLPQLVEAPHGATLPNIFPLKPTISMPEEQFYEMKNVFPLKPSPDQQFIHTAILHFNAISETKNLYDTPVNDSQFLSRALVKSFAIAAAQARFIYGEDVEDLPEPVVIQTIQTDSTNFHFSVFQLNTLNINSDSNVRNVWWSDPIIRLFSEAGFVDAIPVLDDYNPEVFEKFLAFYANRAYQS